MQRAFGDQVQMPLRKVLDEIDASMTTLKGLIQQESRVVES